MNYLSYDEIASIHDRLIEEFGGLRGIRDKGLLESAIASPEMAVFGKELHPSIYDKASAYLFGIARNHPFLDGNKRTATATALIFLRRNGKNPIYDPNDLSEWVVEIANGDRDILSTSYYFKSLCEQST